MHSGIIGESSNRVLAAAHSSGEFHVELQVNNGELAEKVFEGGDAM